jgi:hypothetical protein
MSSYLTEHYKTRQITYTNSFSANFSSDILKNTLHVGKTLQARTLVVLSSNLDCVISYHLPVLVFLSLSRQISLQVLQMEHDRLLCSAPPLALHNHISISNDAIQTLQVTQ